MPLLVHGVLAASSDGSLDAAAMTETAGGEVDLVAVGGLVAVTSEIETDEAVPSRVNLMAHARLLEFLAEDATVAPMRFGVVVADRPTLEAHLTERAEELLGVLQRLEGHLELRLRGRYDEAEVLRELVTTDRRVARLRGSTSFDARMELGERVVNGITARRDADREHVLRRLEPYVADVAVSEVAEPLDAFALSLLVSREGMGAFDDEIESLGTDLSPTVLLELVGPVPPFSFAGTGDA
jgi:hypothetical protein